MLTSEYLSDEEDQLFWEFLEGTKEFHWMYSTEQGVWGCGWVGGGCLCGCDV